MNKLTSIFVISAFLSNVALADCNFKTDIVEQKDGTFIYTEECHIKVGEMKQDLEIAQDQIKDYKKAIELKDLAITRADERADKWMNVAYKLEDRMSTIDDLRSRNQWLYFGFGVGLTALAVWGAGQLR
jgi:hypothetical protein